MKLKVGWVGPGEVKTAQEIERKLLEGVPADDPQAPLLKGMSRLYSFWGASCCYGTNQFGTVVGVNFTKLGRQKRNGRIYANLHLIWVHPAQRGKGVGRALCVAMEKRAISSGCTHIKSLAGSNAGLALQHGLGYWCVGVTPEGEAIMDTPLGARGTPPPDVYSDQQVAQLLGKGLRHG